MSDDTWKRPVSYRAGCALRRLAEGRPLIKCSLYYYIEGSDLVHPWTAALLIRQYWVEPEPADGIETRWVITDAGREALTRARTEP
jgi:hypothetical protein